MAFDMPKITRPRFHYPHAREKATGALAGNTKQKQEQKLVIIDTDAGTDDAWALFMAIAAHKDEAVPFKIEAFTCCHGNTTVQNVAKNVTRTLQTVNENTIPVYQGSEFPLTVKLIVEENYHGDDGFGDADLPPIEAVLEAEHGVLALIRLAEEKKGLLSVLALGLGPLTNLAMAIRLKPEIKDFFKEIVVMGGNIEGLGNTTPGGEYNFLSDVEAACTVLENYTCPIIIVPWETCSRYATSTYPFRVEVLGNMGTAQIELLNAIEANILESVTGSWLAPDPVAAAVLIEPAVATKTEFQYCTVELQGMHTRGMMVVDRNGFLEKPPNCTLITDVDLPLYEKMLVWAAGGPYYQSRRSKGA